VGGKSEGGMLGGGFEGGERVGPGAGLAVVRSGGGGGSRLPVDFQSRACHESEDRYNYIIIIKSLQLERHPLHRLSREQIYIIIKL